MPSAITSARLRAAIVVIALSALAAASACTPHHSQSTFGVEGPVARQQADLFKFIFWIAAFVFVVVEAAVVVIALRYRAKKNDRMPAQTHGNTRLEMAWTIVPVFILLAVAIPTVKGIYDTAAPAEDLGEPLHIEAIGHQWWFEFRYPGEEIITANELHVPVSRPVLIDISSQDVIHSFWVPKLAGKVDMIPNNDNQVWFIADTAGEYLGQCAEFCGISHAKMRFRVIAHETSDYDAWVSSMHMSPDSPAAGSNEAAGQTLFTVNCSMCHSTATYAEGTYTSEVEIQDSRWAAWAASPDAEDAAAARIVSAPNLTHFGARTTLGAGLRELTRAELVTWITDPSDIKQGTRMQEHALVYQTESGEADLSGDDIGKIADFLMSLKPGKGGAVTPPPATGGDPVARGQALFSASGCSGCHSTGDNQVVGPGLKGVYERAAARKPDTTADAYITESVRNPTVFVVPGFGPSMPTFPQLSAGDVSDLVEYLKTLK